MTREEEMLMNLVSHWSHFITPAICIHGAWQVTILLHNYQQEQDINNSFTATLDAPSPLLCFKSNKNCNLSITYTNIQFTPTVYLCGSLTL